jgi:hypothetical protein
VLFGVLRWPLPRFSSFIEKATRWLGGGVICFAVGAYVLSAAFVLSTALELEGAVVEILALRRKSLPLAYRRRLCFGPSLFAAGPPSGPRYYDCRFTEVLAEARGVSGFDFEVSETDCWHSPAVSVYVLKPGRSKKTRLFQYTRLRNTDPPAVITSTGEHSVLISLSSASTLDCRRDTWKALTVRYDIGPVKHAGLQAQPPEC